MRHDNDYAHTWDNLPPDWPLGYQLRGKPLVIDGVEVVEDPNQKLRDDPHYSDNRFLGGGKTVYWNPAYGKCPKGGEYADVQIPNARAAYDDRLQQADPVAHARGIRACEDAVARGQAVAHSARAYEAYLSAYHNASAVLVHMVAGVNRSNGYSYRAYRYVLASEVG